MPPTSPYNAKDIGPQDYVVVLAPKNEDDPCYFDIPGIPEKVWVARVHSIVTKGNVNPVCYLNGYFAWNMTRTLTKPLIFRKKVEDIDFKEVSLVGVFDAEKDFQFTSKNIKDLIDTIKSLE